MLRTIAVLVLLGSLMTACASTEEPAPAPAPVAAPAPAPAPEPEPYVEPEPEPVALLPDTATQLPAVGLAGVGALGLAGVVALVRRRVR